MYSGTFFIYLFLSVLYTHLQRTMTNKQSERIGQIWYPNRSSSVLAVFYTELMMELISRPYNCDCHMTMPMVFNSNETATLSQVSHMVPHTLINTRTHGNHFKTHALRCKRNAHSAKNHLFCWRKSLYIHKIAGLDKSIYLPYLVI